MAKKKVKTISFEEIVEKYDITLDEVKELAYRFNLPGEVFPEGLLDELILVIIQPNFRDAEPAQNGYIMYDLNNKPRGVYYGEPTWVTLSELKVIKRTGIQAVLSDRRTAARGKESKFSKMKMELRYTVTERELFSDLKRS